MAEGEIAGIFFRDAGNYNLPSLSRKRVANNVTTIVSKNGLEGSLEYHRLPRVKKSNVFPKGGKRDPFDRAILVQSVENYNILQSEFPDIKHFDAPNFGENLLITGFNIFDVCIGDRFEIIRNESVVCVIEAASPRRPCHKIKTKFSDKICKYTAATSLAGWFFRVISEGSVCIEDRIKLKNRPNPNWNSHRLCKLLFSETNLTYKLPRWIGTQDEFNEILAMPELTYYEYDNNELYFNNYSSQI